MLSFTNPADPAARAFTLIELLVVVAIIAILAAIAVPNFLEAQTRTKVSRGKAEIHTLVSGLQQYYVDNNHFPADWGDDEWRSWTYLTTPVAYLSSVVTAPFPMRNHPANGAQSGSFRLPPAYVAPDGTPALREQAASAGFFLA